MEQPPGKETCPCLKRATKGANAQMDARMVLTSS